MTHIENYCKRELLELRETAKELCIQPDFRLIKDICAIALVEINRELDERKIRKEVY